MIQGYGVRMSPDITDTAYTAICPIEALMPRSGLVVAGHLSCLACSHHPLPARTLSSGLEATWEVNLSKESH